MPHSWGTVHCQLTYISSWKPHSFEFPVCANSVRGASEHPGHPSSPVHFPGWRWLTWARTHTVYTPLSCAFCRQLLSPWGLSARWCLFPIYQAHNSRINDDETLSIQRERKRATVTESMYCVFILINQPNQSLEVQKPLLCQLDCPGEERVKGFCDILAGSPTPAQSKNLEAGEGLGALTLFPGYMGQWGPNSPESAAPN